MPMKASEIVNNKATEFAQLSLIALEGARELGEKINKHIVGWAEEDLQNNNVDNFLTRAECPRFSSGDAKGLIRRTVRGDDLFIIVDIGNYSVKYSMFGEDNRMSPDDHFQDLKRIIQAAGGKARRINVIMPILYGGRQHRRNYRESLDCAVALQELQNMGVKNIITFDAHDSRVCNAVPLMGFDNVIPNYQVLKSILNNVKNFKPNASNFMVVSPDEGAMHRNEYYASRLGVELGMFYKRRDYTKMQNGRNPIVAHEYLGNSVKGKDVFISDDIISSGDSMLKVARELKKREAARIFVYATYPIFTNGFEMFDEAYKEGVFDYVFGTNLTYRAPELLRKDWFCEVDVSKYIAYLIVALNHGVPTSKVIDPSYKVKALLEKRGIKVPTL